MPDENPHFRAAMRHATPELPAADEESGLPPLKERQYLAHSRPANKPLYSLHFVTPQGEVRSFQYVHLDSHSSYTAECITLSFLGMRPVKVAIRGRNLWRLYDYIHQHRVAWIVQASRDFARDGETIISDVRFTAVAEDEHTA